MLPEVSTQNMEVFSLLDSDDEAPPTSAALIRSSSRDVTVQSRHEPAPLRSTAIPDSVNALATRKRVRADVLTGGAVPMIEEALLLRERDSTLHDLHSKKQSEMVEKLQKQVTRQHGGCGPC